MCFSCEIILDSEIDRCIYLSHIQYILQVCGNNKAVGFLTEWLTSWQEKGSQACKNIEAIQKNITIDISDNSSQSDDISQSVSLVQTDSDFDLEIEDEETQLGNVLLVTGPVGVRYNMFFEIIYKKMVVTCGEDDSFILPIY